MGKLKKIVLQSCVHSHVKMTCAKWAFNPSLPWFCSPAQNRSVLKVWSPEQQPWTFSWGFSKYWLMRILCTRDSRCYIVREPFQLCTMVPSWSRHLVHPPPFLWIVVSWWNFYLFSYKRIPESFRFNNVFLKNLLQYTPFFFLGAWGM